MKKLVQKLIAAKSTAPANARLKNEKSKAPCGKFIVLNRRFSPPGISGAKPGPAAIIQKCKSNGMGVAMIARYLLLGWDFASWAGAKKGLTHSVLVLAPYVPDMAFIRRFLEIEIDWRHWDGGALPDTKADAIIVWMPKNVLPRMTLKQSAKHLVDAAFGGGEIYSAINVDALEVRHA